MGDVPVLTLLYKLDRLPQWLTISGGPEETMVRSTSSMQPDATAKIATMTPIRIFMLLSIACIVALGYRSGQRDSAPRRMQVK